MDPFRIITRAEWKAQRPNGYGYAGTTWSASYLHHSAAMMPDLLWLDPDRDGVDDDERAAMRQLEEIGQDRFGSGISYTWCVSPSGRIYEGHGEFQLGAHTAGRNGVARGICLMGNYHLNPVTLAQERSVAWLLQRNRSLGRTPLAALTGPHSAVKATECPGDFGRLAIPSMNRLAAGAPVVHVPAPAPDPEEDPVTQYYGKAEDKADIYMFRLEPEGRVCRRLTPEEWQVIRDSGAKLSVAEKGKPSDGFRALVSAIEARMKLDGIQIKV